MKRYVISVLALLPMMAIADLPNVVEADSVASVDAAAVDSMASHYLKQVIDDEKKSEPSIFAFDDPERQKKHPWKAAIETFGINVLVQSFDRFILDADFAQISFNSIKHTEWFCVGQRPVLHQPFCPSISWWTLFQCRP